MGGSRERKHLGPRRRRLDGAEGTDFVRCRICGDHRRVISGRHLSKHDTDRETYMEEYHLTSDELIAKDFRVLQSSRRGYSPHSKSEWIAATKTFHERHGKVFAKYLQRRCTPRSCCRLVPKPFPSSRLQRPPRDWPLSPQAQGL